MNRQGPFRNLLRFERSGPADVPNPPSDLKRGRPPPPLARGSSPCFPWRCLELHGPRGAYADSAGTLAIRSFRRWPCPRWDLIPARQAYRLSDQILVPASGSAPELSAYETDVILVRPGWPVVLEFFVHTAFEPGGMIFILRAFFWSWRPVLHRHLPAYKAEALLLSYTSKSTIMWPLRAVP